MTPEQFNMLDDHFMKHVNAILHGKGLRYTDEDNRFYNFMEAADLGGTTILHEMLAGLRKHLVALCTLFRRNPAGNVSANDFLEHGGDTINYIRMINAHLKEGEPGYVSCDLPYCNCATPGELCDQE